MNGQAFGGNLAKRTAGDSYTIVRRRQDIRRGRADATTAGANERVRGTETLTGFQVYSSRGHCAPLQFERLHPSIIPIRCVIVCHVSGSARPNQARSEG